MAVSSVTMLDGGGASPKIDPLDALSQAQTDEERFRVLTTLFGLNPEQARENIASLNLGMPAKNTASPTGLWTGDVGSGNIAGAPLAVVEGGMGAAFTQEQIGNMSPAEIAKQLGFDLNKTTIPGTGADVLGTLNSGSGAPKQPPAGTISPFPAPAAAQPRTAAPEIKPFEFTPSRTLDPEQARQQAGLRAYQQVSPQILAKQQQQELAMQGLEMLRQTLQQGVQQATDETLRGVPKLTDQMRRLRASTGLSESGFIDAGQKEIQKGALQTIADRASQASLTEQQAAQKVMLDQQQRQQEIAALQGQVSTDDQGNFVGTLVDTLTEEILDRNVEMGMQEKGLSLQEYQIVNSIAMDMWKAQESIRQGDEQLAAQYQQMAQQNARALEQLQLQKDEFGFEQRKYNEGSEMRGLQVDQARSSLDNLKELFPLEKEAMQQKVDAGTLQAQLGELELAEARFLSTLMNDKELGKRAQAVQELEQIRAQIELVKAQTQKALQAPEPKTTDYTSQYGPTANSLIQQARQAEATGDQAGAQALYDQAMQEARKWEQGTAKPATPTAPKDYTAQWGPVANSLIQQAKQAESSGDMERANALFQQAMQEAQKWETGTAKPTTPTQGKLDPYTMENLNNLGVTDIGLTQNPQAFLDRARMIQNMIFSGTSIKEVRDDWDVLDDPNDLTDTEVLSKLGVDPKAFKAWLFSDAALKKWQSQLDYGMR